MPFCNECYSRDLVRYGEYDGKQKWHCNNCGLTSIFIRLRKPVKRKRHNKATSIDLNKLPQGDNK